MPQGQSRRQRSEVGSQKSDLRPPTSDLRPLVLAGPTAVGKSEIALALAEQLGGEIISVDSMQVYRGLDIGTAKPPPAERARVTHHLIDVADLSEPFDAAKFAQRARAAVVEIQSRQRLPILCGGTGLYFKAFLDGLGDAPPADATLRAELEATPVADLLRELAERDPATYEKIDRQNPRRVIRAVEVIRLSGKPFSAQRARWGETPGEPRSADIPVRGFTGHSCPVSAELATGRRRAEAALWRAAKAEKSPEPADKNVCATIRLIGLARSSADLHTRINTRVDDMFRRGLVAETEQLLKLGLAENKTAMQALGYRQVVEHLQGRRSLSETVERVKIRTRQFAKRQMTWFKRQMSLEWIELSAEDSPAVVAALVKARMEKPT